MDKTIWWGEAADKKNLRGGGRLETDDQGKLMFLKENTKGETEARRRKGWRPRKEEVEFMISFYG
jgi:hypothetical protein